MKISNKSKFFVHLTMRLILICLIILGIAYIADEIEYVMYPIKYEEIVNKYAEEYNLDPFLIYAMIKVESSFNANAISNKNARGLMQIMPSTGNWIAQKLKIENFDTEDLFEPEKNIMMGTWYIDYLIEKFNGDVSLAIIAYNAGPGSVQSWLLDESVSHDGETLDNIPFGETANYEKKIIDSYNNYQRIYKNIMKK